MARHSKSGGKDLKGRAMPGKSSSSSPGYVWLLAGVAIGLFAAFLVYLAKQPKEQLSFSQAVVKELEKSKTADKKTAKPADENSKPAREPKFEFYTLLPESEVFVPEPAEHKSKPVDNAPGPGTSSGKQYLLQAASFRNHADADNLKASLALLGITSSIQSVTVNNDTWHRVRIGPFSDERKLRETLATLKSNNIQAMTMELK